MTDESNLRTNLILSSHLRLGLLSGSFLQASRSKTYLYLSCVPRVPHAQPITRSVNLIPRITFNREYNWWSSSLYSLRYIKNLQKEVFSNSCTTSTCFLQRGVQRGSENRPSSYRMICKSSAQRHRAESEHKLARASVCSTSRIRRHSLHADSERTRNKYCGLLRTTTGIRICFFLVLRRSNVIVPRGKR